MDKIDFVLPWVDGSDPLWLEQKNQYSPKKVDYSTNINRFRDWDNLQYWFRGVEKYAPWVNNIYFITWGHLPKWLNTEHPKLKIIKHTDYIPEKYLPTFNSNVIEINLHRISDLSETFVLFNDDTFLIRDVSPEDFFIEGTPRDTFVESLIAADGRGSGIIHIKANNTDVINANFSKREIHRKYRWKIYNRKYGLQNLITLYFFPFSYFTSFRNPHIPIAHLKSTFTKVWEKAADEVHATCLNKFRGYNDISHWLMRYWNLCSGDFVPQNIKFGKYFEATQDNSKLCRYIRNQKGKMICINDMSTDFDFETAKLDLCKAFHEILPKKSSYEL